MTGLGGCIGGGGEKSQGIAQVSVLTRVIH